MQRIYGTSFPSQAELDDFLHKLEEAKRRDHRRLGPELGLFSVEEEAGPGLVFWHPKGGIVRHLMESWLRDELLRRGYQLVYTPHAMRIDLWKTSGHLDYYRENMFPAMEGEHVAYQLKPMNCPGHILIYRSRGRSYRELPLRWAELGTVYRYERSGVLHGMLRVRGFTQDDSHIFCTPEQLPAEIAGVLELVAFTLKTFGFEYAPYLATRPAEKSIGSDEFWERATAALRDGAALAGMRLELDEGGGAFYGPKIDFKLKDALGREWQCSTVQCDYNLPERFDLLFTDKDGHKKRPIMVHRAVLGSFERFVGGLIEHYGGRFPFWLAPTQVALVPIRESHASYCRDLAGRLGAERFRVECLDEPGHMNKKIQAAERDKVPFMLIAGDREVEARAVTVRRRGVKEQETVAFERFHDLARRLRESRSEHLA
jgi:threonyl-tRNA synthetase